MVLELREAGDRDGADAADPAHEDRKRAPMRGVLRHVEPSVPVKGPSVDPELLADTKRRAAVAVDDRTLAVQPAVIVGGCAGQCGIPAKYGWPRS